LNPLLLAVLLQLVAAVIIMVEVIIPSGGLLGLLAVGLVGYSLYTVFTAVSVSAGYILAGLDVVLLPLLILAGLKLLARSPATLSSRLSSGDGFSSQSPDLEGSLGKEGVALTDLRPAGIARIDGRRLDVVSRGEYIDKGAKIVVGAVTGNQIIVHVP